MKFDLTVTITGILAISAIISPIATAIINNHYQLKLKKLELEQDHLNNTTYYIRSIFENYLRYAGKCIYFSNQENETGYNEYYFLALVYAPAQIAESLISINALIYDNHSSEASARLEELRPQINELLQHL